jgi:hypothetical protein
MSEAWEEGGVAAIKRVMDEEPGRFLTVVAQALPKDVNVKHDSTDAFLQLWKLISDGQAEMRAGRRRGIRLPVTREASMKPSARGQSSMILLTACPFRAGQCGARRTCHR